ncbi:MAG: potassium channel family protein [Rhodospirillales bacterium]
MSAEKPQKSQPFRRFRAGLITLYHGDHRAAQRFRYGLIAFDSVTILFFIVSSMLPLTSWIVGVDLAIAFVLTLDLVARAIVATRTWRFLLSFGAIVDLVVILSLLAAALLENLSFLRILRTLRLLRSYHLLGELRRTWSWFRRNEEVIQSSLNLSVFVFTVTAIVFVVERDKNDGINNYFDALYFTVTTLTTTGFGDIILTDTLGRALAVVIMVFGVGLFLRLIQTIFRPPKVVYPCPDCGLTRHDPDAVHCKHCGTVLNIPTEGDWA